MAHDSTTAPHAGETHAPDAIEAIVPLMPIVLPAVGAVIMVTGAALSSKLVAFTIDIFSRISQG